MRGRKWWFVAAGVLVSARWWSRIEPAPAAVVEVEPARVAADERAALATGDFELELTRRRRAPRSKRFVTSVLFAALFCAGASLTAIAGNEVVTTAPTVAAEAAPDPAPETPAPETTAPESPAPEIVAPETTTEAAPAPAPAPEAGPTEPVTTTTAAAPDPAPAAAPATTTAEAPPAPAAADPTPTTAAAPVDDVTPGTAPVRSGYVASVAPAPASKPKPARHVAVRAQAVEPAAATPSIVQIEPTVPSFVPAAPFDLPAWEHDNPTTTTGAAAVAIAEHFIGTPYVWGGATPTGGFDCSGLMLYVYAQLGVALPHYAASQFALFPHLQPSELRPGDLVFFEPKIDGPGHVAMYAGGDAIIEAPHTGALVRIGSLARDAAALGFLGAVRPYGSAAIAGPRTIARHSTRAEASGPGTAFTVYAV